MARKSKLFKVNRKSVSFGVGPFRTNVGTKGVRYSANLPGGQRVQKTVGWGSGGKSAGASSPSRATTPTVPAEPMFKTARAKWIGYPGCSLAILSVLFMCADFTTGLVMLGIGSWLAWSAQRIDRKVASTQAPDDNDENGVAAVDTEGGDPPVAEQ